jgi:hypothetical protein
MQQITLHFVIRDVHPVGTLINKHCDWSVGSSLGHVLDHFFHDEWIADHKPHDVRRLGSGFATQNIAQVELREEHKVRSAEAALYNALQIREGIGHSRLFEKFDYVRLSDRGLEGGHNSVEWF